MSCSVVLCHVFMASVALSMLLAVFHASELQTAFRHAVDYARGQTPAQTAARQQASLEALTDLSRSAEMRAAQDLSTVFAGDDAGWARWFGIGEARDDAHDEDDVSLLLKEAEVLESQWRFHPAELKLHRAYERASGWLSDLEQDGKPTPQVHRAKHQAMEVLLRLGQFLEGRNRAAEAVASFRLAKKIASSLTALAKSPVQSSAKGAGLADFLGRLQAERETQALAAQARSAASLARALCRAGGRRGDAVKEARVLFIAALSRKPRPAASLEAEIHADFAECLHREGALAEARAGLTATQRLLENAGEDSGWLVAERAALQRRLGRLQGGVSHDEGAFSDAIRLYSHYLNTAPNSNDDLPALTEVLQRFEVMQDMSLALASLGKVQEAFATMDDIDRLQKVSGEELSLKSWHSAIQKFLGSSIEDACLGASMGRSRVVRAELVLEQSRAQMQRPPQQALHLAEEGVAFLRKHSASAEGLENSLNTLGNVRMSLGAASGARDAYDEAVKLAETDHGEKSPLVAALYHNVASALEGMGRLPEAVKLYTQALNIQVAALGEANPDTAGSLDSIARVLSKSGLRAEALDAAKRAVKAARAVYPDGHWLRRETEARLKKLIGPTTLSSHEFLVSAQKVHHVADA